ncbi:Nlrc5 [Symbiodinium sp. CCMP2592]|nr:Nlrc5 [Symbiodinium sp. CCMP2592]
MARLPGQPALEALALASFSSSHRIHGASQAISRLDSLPGMPELPEEAAPASAQLSLPSRRRCGAAEPRLRGDLAAASRDLSGLRAQARHVEDMMQASRSILGDVCLKQLDHLTAPSEKAKSAAQLRQVRALVEVQEDLRKTMQEKELRSRLQEQQSLHRKELEEQRASSQQALEEQKEFFEKALKAVLPAADGSHSASKAFAAEEVAVPIDQVPRGLRLDDLLRLVEENKEWLQGPTAREKMTGRKNMYDVTPELIIARSPGEERIVELAEEDAEKIAKSLAGGDDGIFVKGSLQCREGAKLGGLPVENLVIQGVLCEDGAQRREYWKHGSDAWLMHMGAHGALAHHGQDAIPARLLGKQLGEANARRKKELLKQQYSGLSQVAYVGVVKQGEFETLCFAKSLRLHAEKVHPGNPGAMCYYICSLLGRVGLVRLIRSIEAGSFQDLGTDWQSSPFNRALEHVAACSDLSRRMKQDSVYCAVMLHRFDERCSTLEWRIWCIFEIWRCCKLELRLDLFSVEGQLTRISSTPLACKIRKQAKGLDMSNTKCSEKRDARLINDQRMIEQAIKTSGTTWAQIAGMIQLQISSLVEFSASLAISRNALTGAAYLTDLSGVLPKLLWHSNVQCANQEIVSQWMENQLGSAEVRDSSSIINDCIKARKTWDRGVGPWLHCCRASFSASSSLDKEAAQSREESRAGAACLLGGGVQETVIPLRVPLAELADIKEGVDLFKAWAQRAFGSDSDEILRGDRRLVLVLDGLDEAATARRRVLKWLQKWLQANGHRCVCIIVASRPSGTNQVLGSDGSAREPAGSAVLGQLSETSLLTQEPLPVSCHVRLHDGAGQSLGAATVLSCEEGFLLKKKKDEVGLKPGVPPLKVRRKDPKQVFSATVCLDYADRSSARALLERAFREAGGDPKEESHFVVARRADGEVWKDDSPISYGQMLSWPKGAFPCRAFLKTKNLKTKVNTADGEVEDVQVSLCETSSGIFLSADLEPGDEVELSSGLQELLPLDRCFRVVLDTPVPSCPAMLNEMTAQDELSLQLGFAPFEILPLSPPVASRISKFGEEELRALPEAVWRTPLMASILGTYPRGQKEEELDGATAELVLMEHAVETLLKQAEERTGCKELRAELGPLCLAKLQVGQRLLLESDFTSQVVFQEAQLGHLRFFEPSGQAVQLYHLRMQEYLAAEARLAGAQAPAWKQAFAEAQQQPMLRGALRFCLMMQTAHAAEAEIDLSSLSSSKLGAADAEAFQGALLCSEKLVLDLDGNHLGPEGGSSLASALPKRLRRLELKLAGNRIGVEGTRALAASLAELPLQELRLSLMMNGIGDDGAQALAAAMAKLPQLQKLDLSVNSLGAEGAQALAAAMAKLPQLQKLALDLSVNSLGVEGARALAASLAELPLQELQLGLNRNEIGAEGAQALAAAIAKLPQLQKLALFLSNNSLGDEGTRALATSLAELPLQELRLDLERNEIGDEGTRALSASLAELPLQELRLELRYNKIGAEGAQALAAAIAKLPQLQKLELFLSNKSLGEEVRDQLRGQLKALPIPEKGIDI